MCRPTFCELSASFGLLVINSSSELTFSMSIGAFIASPTVSLDFNKPGEGGRGTLAWNGHIFVL